MNDEQKSIAANQWTLLPEGETEQQPAQPELPVAPEPEKPKSPEQDTYRKIGFFEAISGSNPYHQKLENLLDRYREKAREKIARIDAWYEKKIQHLRNRITLAQERIRELELKIAVAEQYNEKDDIQLQELLKEKTKQEEELALSRQQLTEVRVRLGEAKAGIINKSLDEAEAQVKKALNIQHIVYEETRLINRKKYDDEKDYLQRLSKCYEDLLEYYKKRYDKVHRYLQVLDVDGISPITANTLTTIGTVSFGAAGFFFSTFAYNAGFGNQDMLYYVLDGLIRTARQPAGGVAKLLILLALITAVTLISLLCDFLIQRLNRRHDEEILSKISLGAQASNKIDLLEYQLNLKSSNWYAFWLQLVPGIFVAGLIILSLSQNYRSSELNKINASSEGLIIGTAIAISLAGVIYLYITKIVEPRLLKRYDADPATRINWVRANWELVAVVLLFIVFSITVIVAPYGLAGVAMPADHQVRLALLLFFAICIVGSMSFAYGVRNKGLLQTGRYIERVIKWLNKVIAYCSSPEAPEVHHKLAAEHGNVLEHVLKQLSFKAAVNIGDGRVRRRTKPAGFFGPLMDALKRSKKEEEDINSQHLETLTLMEPWEARYFPHIVDELKAKDFEFREKQQKLQAVQDSITDHKAQHTNKLRMMENEIAISREAIRDLETKVEETVREQAERVQEEEQLNDQITCQLQDGFFLGTQYKESSVAHRAELNNHAPSIHIITPQ